MEKNNIIKNIILNIKFYFNIENNLNYNFKIFIYKFNIKNNNIFNYFKNIKCKNMFNFRNKFNFNKSKRNITNKKRTGNSRLGSCSSNIFKNGLLWYGFRNIKVKKIKSNKHFLYNILINKKKELFISNLELIKFIYDIYNYKFYTYYFNKFNNCITLFYNKIKTYKNLINKKLNIIY